MRSASASRRRKEARALGEAPVTDETAETTEGEAPLDDVQLDADVSAGESLD